MAEVVLNILILDLSMRTQKEVVIHTQQIDHRMHGIVLGEESRGSCKITFIFMKLNLKTCISIIIFQYVTKETSGELPTYFTLSYICGL